MKATDLLKQQHDEVKDLFKKMEAASRPAVKQQLFAELAANLVAHDGIERELFYPACEAKLGTTDLLGEALVEHGVVEFSLFQADEAQGKDDFDYKVTVLKEVLEHHIDEEEGELFPKASRALGKDALEALGNEMEAKFEQLKQADFRGPLRSNLKQVLQGALKPTPKSKSVAAPARASKASAGASKTSKTARKAVTPVARKAGKKQRNAARRP